jgi:hypothetical protein
MDNLCVLDEAKVRLCNVSAPKVISSEINLIVFGLDHTNNIILFLREFVFAEAMEFAMGINVVGSNLALTRGEVYGSSLF